MNKMPLIAPSLMCMDLTKLAEQIEFFDDKVGYYHVDIMDGHFVPNLTLSPFFVSQLKKISTAPMDCHLMVTNPEQYVDMLAEAGAAMFSFHAETVNGKAFRLIEDVRKKGMQVGVVLNPETRLQDVEIYLKHIDKVTLMTVDPGFAGQSFVPEVVDKIRQFREFREQHQLEFQIEIDGSCNKKTFSTLLAAGADVLIVGTSGLFNNHPELSVAWGMMMDDIKVAALEVA
ncbi:D-allulose 6-phosphate 3-epimerase [Vibrio panuliri]|uniref:Allulose-6-phosphate 3-epimerase n=1 Tax=Vibrio panuliri TaxID=1381081 RepID=A0ABX3FDJ1_9VIBR|nr:D-allulose 6-phosphate 3-epimerase [Vibrio panuliri]KAB1457132.1 ribulose-phosphate 3-epimerase [Vibrio panuliri]OLQ87623.1 allulose-6-phosphate 3-epimerase [Vibrio panuliri]